jgi:hypothetical protein
MTLPRFGGDFLWRAERRARLESSRARTRLQTETLPTAAVQRSTVISPGARERNGSIPPEVLEPSNCRKRALSGGSALGGPIRDFQSLQFPKMAGRCGFAYDDVASFIAAATCRRDGRRWVAQGMREDQHGVRDSVDRQSCHRARFAEHS